MKLRNDYDNCERISVLEKENIFRESRYLMDNKHKRCHKCLLVKPKRAHHCKICDQCILKMDHHCPWLMNCVGF